MNESPAKITLLSTTVAAMFRPSVNHDQRDYLVALDLDLQSLDLSIQDCLRSASHEFSTAGIRLPINTSPGVRVRCLPKHAFREDVYQRLIAVVGRPPSFHGKALFFDCLADFDSFDSDDFALFAFTGNLEITIRHSRRITVAATFSLHDLVNARIALTPEHQLPTVIAFFAKQCPNTLVPCFLAGGAVIDDVHATHVRPMPALDSETLALLLSSDDGALREVVTTSLLPKMTPTNPFR